MAAGSRTSIFFSYNITHPRQASRKGSSRLQIPPPTNYITRPIIFTMAWTNKMGNYMLLSPWSTLFWLYAMRQLRASFRKKRADQDNVEHLLVKNMASDALWGSGRWKK